MMAADGKQEMLLDECRDAASAFASPVLSEPSPMAVNAVLLTAIVGTGQRSVVGSWRRWVICVRLRGSFRAT